MSLIVSVVRDLTLPVVLYVSTVLFFGGPTEAAIGFADVVLCTILSAYFLSNIVLHMTHPSEWFSSEVTNARDPSEYAEESRFALVLCMVHITKFVFRRNFFDGGIQEAEIALCILVIGLFLWIHIYETGTFLHYVALWWAMSDAARCFLDLTFFRGSTIAVQIAPYVHEVFGAMMTVPLFLAVLSTSPFQPWMLGYLLFVSCGLTPIIEKQGVLLLLEAPKFNIPLLKTESEPTPPKAITPQPDLLFLDFNAELLAPPVKPVELN